MTLKKALRLLAFDAAVAALFTLLLAKPFLGRFMDSFLYAIPAGLVLLAAGAAFVFVNWKALAGRPYGRGGGDTAEACIEDINYYISSNIQTFRPDLFELAEQLEKLRQKKGAIRQALLERFQPTELAFAKFASAADRAEGYLLSNARTVLSRVNTFDEKEYEDIMNSPDTTRDEFKARKRIYDDVLADVADRVNQGGKILLALDKLLMAVSDISTIGSQRDDTETAVREIDGLVKDVAFYKGAMKG
jgi:hypothetical protein